VPLPDISGSLPSELNSRIDAKFSPLGGLDQHPSIGANARMAVADGNRDLLQIAGGRFESPGQKEIVLGAVRFGEGNNHGSAGAAGRTRR
jgi:hypothetical protein